MKRSITSILALSILLTGCGAPRELGENSQQKFYPTYGIFNEGSNKSKKVCYEISLGNVVWSIILIETVIAPMYFIGYDLYNPIRLKTGPGDECTFDSGSE